MVLSHVTPASHQLCIPGTSGAHDPWNRIGHLAIAFPDHRWDSRYSLDERAFCAHAISGHRARLSRSLRALPYSDPFKRPAPTVASRSNSQASCRPMSPRVKAPSLAGVRIRARTRRSSPRLPLRVASSPRGTATARARAHPAFCSSHTLPTTTCTARVPASNRFCGPSLSAREVLEWSQASHRVSTAAAPAQSDFQEGSSVTLVATAGDHAKFRGWGGACAESGRNPQCTIEIPTSNVAVTARFTGH